MKIGIVTYHTAINPGAFLQVYALQMLLKKTGYDVEVVNYLNFAAIKKEITSCIYRNKGLKRILELKSILKYLFFQYRYLKLSRFILKPSSSYLTKYDALIFGSDEIWNYENYFFKLTPIFFGMGIHGIKKISYAPSFGHINDDNTLPNVVQSAINDIDFVSVRDANSQSILEKNFPEKVSSVCLDPTFLYSFDDEINPPKSSNQRKATKFFLIYANTISDERRKEILEFSQSKNLKTIVIGSRQSWANESYTDMSPFKILKLFQDAEFIFTNTFHGTIFCLKYNCNFVIEINSGKKNKLDFLTNTFEVQHRVVTQTDKILPILMQVQSDKSQINILKLIEIHKKSSIDFLHHALNSSIAQSGKIKQNN
ncbi:MAG: polysaccharide pyruvyl transferase family protein [Nodularia sp. CChRGM 3473]